MYGYTQIAYSYAEEASRGSAGGQARCPAQPRRGSRKEPPAGGSRQSKDSVPGRCAAQRMVYVKPMLGFRNAPVAVSLTVAEPPLTLARRKEGPPASSKKPLKPGATA